MVLYSSQLVTAWRELEKSYNSHKFTPKKEADVQFFLGHLLIKNKVPVNKIHFEQREKEGQKRYDIVLGNRGVGLFIEIKFFKRVYRKTPHHSWQRDIDKLSSAEGNRKPCFILFIDNLNKKNSKKENEFKKTLENFEKENKQKAIVLSNLLPR